MIGTTIETTMLGRLLRATRVLALSLSVLVFASFAGAYECHNSLAVDIYRPTQKVWADSLGFDAQVGGWFAPYTAVSLGVGALMLQTHTSALEPVPLASPAAGVDPSGLELAGMAPSFHLGPSVWIVAPMTDSLAISCDLGCRYALNPHGPTVLGRQTLEDGTVHEYSATIELTDGLIVRSSAHIEALLRYSAVAFAGVVWQHTLTGYEATLEGVPLGRFDIDGIMFRLGFRANW